MSRSQNSFIKHQKEKQRQKKRKDKEDKKKERHENSKGGALEDMLAWVDENGNLTTKPNGTPGKPTNTPSGS